MAIPVEDPPEETAADFETRTLDPLELNLDPYNPRLTRDEEGSSQNRLLQIMIERFKVEELAASIVATGFYTFDPVIGCEENGGVMVVEGSRHLATIKLLLDPGLAPESRRARWEELSGELSEAYRQGIASLDVRVYPERDAIDLTAYLGFRHVTGALRWPAFEKASFIATMVDRGMTYRAIAKRIGSYPTHVERHYVAYRLVTQAREDGIPGTERMEKLFGVLLRALQATDIGQFLGIEYPGDHQQSQRPVANERAQQLREFVEWTFGTEEKARVVKDSRDLTKWGKILQSPTAVRYLRGAPQPDFGRAWLKSGGQVESLVESLFAAADRLEESVPLVSEHTDSEEVQEAVRQCTRFLYGVA